jgi:hypothetical protein
MNTSGLRAYTLDHYAVKDPDGCTDVVLNRPLSFTVGTQALEPDVANAKTLLRVALLSGNALLERAPKMKVRVFARGNGLDHTCAPAVFEDPLFVEMLFDNATFATEQKGMPIWLVEGLEFAAKTLRAQYELNKLCPFVEAVE